jgi:hypothetical protein
MTEPANPIHPFPVTGAMVVARVEQHPTEATMETVLLRGVVDPDGPAVPACVAAAELWLPLGTVRLGEDISLLAIPGAMGTPQPIVRSLTQEQQDHMRMLFDDEGMAAIEELLTDDEREVLHGLAGKMRERLIAKATPPEDRGPEVESDLPPEPTPAEAAANETEAIVKDAGPAIGACDNFEAKDFDMMHCRHCGFPRGEHSHLAAR